MSRKKSQRTKVKPKISDSVTVRLTPRLQTLLGVTAAIFEMTLEEYVLKTLERQADAIVAESPPTRLSARDMRRLLEIIEDPSPPNEALRKAAEEYKKKVGLRPKGEEP
jgi:uncharacterized protein (DUF1778 family)